MHAYRPALASVPRRLFAFMLDTLLQIVVILMTLAAFNLFDDGFMLGVVWLVVIHLGYNWAGLMRPEWGLGKVAADIRVVSLHGGAPTQAQCLVRIGARVLLMVLFLVPAGFNDQPGMLLVPLLLEVGLIATHPRRQSLADLLAGTLVIRQPAAQPHRAPAGPMFSRTDAEFGQPPKSPPRKPD